MKSESPGEVFESQETGCSVCHTGKTGFSESEGNMGNTRWLSEDDLGALEAYLRTL